MTLYSRRGTDLTQRFRHLAVALASLPVKTAIDDEVIALDEQAVRAESHIMLYAFDVLIRRGENLIQQPLSKRREILESTVKAHAHVDISPVSSRTLNEMLVCDRFLMQGTALGPPSPEPQSG